MGTSFSISPTHFQTQMIKTTIAILFCVASAAASVDHRGLEVLVERNGEIEGQIVGEGNRYPGESCEPGEGQCAISLCNAETLTCEEAIAEEIEFEHPEQANVQIVEDDRQLRSANHYARKYDRQVRRANRHAFRASKGGWGHSYRGQQHQLYKAAKHDAKAQYAANMYAAKTGQF